MRLKLVNSEYLLPRRPAIKNPRYPMSRMDPNIAVLRTNMPRLPALNPVLMARTIVPMVCRATHILPVKRRSLFIVDCHGTMPPRVVNCPVLPGMMTIVPKEPIVMPILPVIRRTISCAVLPLRRRVHLAIHHVRVGRVRIVLRI